MIDITLKFKNKAEMEGGLSLIGLEPYGIPHGKFIMDEIGTTYEQSGTVEDPIFTALPGYFVNVRILDETLDTSMLTKYVVVLDPPLRVWA